MNTAIELKLFRSIKTGAGFMKLIKNLKANRRKDKVLNRKRTSLSAFQREIVLKKTDSRCHICGVDLDKNNFQADHVKSHSAGGIHAENNYLTSCSTCNN